MDNPIVVNLGKKTKKAIKKLKKGEGKMVDYFESAGHRCIAAFDIHPLRCDVTKLAAVDQIGRAHV